ncbi:MAG: hypothetical protein IT204_05350 [Fimbriimonadaceae bacterium]|nr:hypothetical protein [Fimbriimonadaceae bacterium]
MRQWLWAGAVCLSLVGLASAADGAYDPLAVPPEATAQTVDLTVHDATRKRDLPLRVYLPAGTAAAPVVLFSHGLGGSCRNNAYLGEHWARRGYVGVFMQHPGSDESVWKGLPARDVLKAMNAAASAQNFQLRMKDVPAVIDQLAVWNQEPGHALRGRLNLEQVGMSGHSFGALTTQAVSGQNYPLIGQAYTDSRIDAAVAYSPSAPTVAAAAAAFGKVAIPWLTMTGTADTSPIGNATVETRRAVYPALPPGDKYGLVLFGAQHSAFSERALPGDRGERNPNHHRVIQAFTMAFWDTYLRGDAAAKAWLRGPAAAALLEAQDEWQQK